MGEDSIRNRLVERGESLFQEPRKPLSFVGVPVADALVDDIDCNPHAFVLACVMDRQIKAEKAWAIPYEVSRRIGGFSIKQLIVIGQYFWMKNGQ